MTYFRFPRSIPLFVLFSWGLSLAGSAQAETAPRETQKTVEPEGDGSPLQIIDLAQAKSQQLKSGLQVVLQATAGAPKVTVCTAFSAGSSADPLESPGAYRVLAEMLKEGGYHSKSQDYAALVVQRGGMSEVRVTRDATTFCTTVPAEELSLALWVAAGRFSPATLSSELMDQVVDQLAKESESQDAKIRHGRAPARLRQMAFLGTYAYSHPILPNPDDLDALSLDTLHELHGRNYVARRATIALSGGFDEKKALSLLDSHFSQVHSGTRAKQSPHALVSQSTGRFSMAEDKKAKTPAAWYGWVAPMGRERRAMRIALLTLLGKNRLGGSLQGRSAKQVELILDEEAAPTSPGLDRLSVLGSGNRSLGVIEKAMDSQLRMLARKGPTSQEVRDAQRQRRVDLARRLENSAARSYALARGVRLGRSTTEILSPLQAKADYPEVKIQEVRLAAAGLLNARQRSSVEIYPRGWQDPWQQPMRQYHIVSRGQTLGSIANRYRTSVAVIVKMNGMRRNKTIYPGDKLRVPRVRGKKPERKLRQHKVRRGDTMGALALRYGVSSRAIADANGMGAKMVIRTGENLRIPWGSKKNSKKSSNSGSPASAKKAQTHSTYRVKSGDTLSGIAAKQGVSTVALARANGISQKSGVRLGQKLKVPPRGTGKKKKDVPLKVHRVKKGDTLSGIASRHGVSVSALTTANGISRKSTLHLGQKLKLPAK